MYPHLQSSARTNPLIVDNITSLHDEDVVCVGGAVGVGALWCDVGGVI